MLFSIIDTKSFSDKTWYLTKCNLFDYLSSLKDGFSDFQIQRKIVKNVYLDSLYESILSGEPMPTITLVGNHEKVQEKDNLEIDNDDFEILDGLQRSFRLWAIWHIYTISHENGITDPIAMYQYIQNDENGEFVLRDTEFVTLKFLKKLYEIVNHKILMENVVEHFKTYEIFCYIWTGLSDRELVRKMLILNAGQKSVSSTHQYELLFLHFFEKNKLTYENGITLFREKDRNYNKIKRGDGREVGQYCLSSVIVALQSFLKGEPVRVAPSNLIGSTWSDSQLEEVDETYFSSENLSMFVNQIYTLDIYYSRISSDYVKWLGKDTTLSGIFAAIGKYCKQTCSQKDVSHLASVLVNNNVDFNIVDFYKAYDQLSSVHSNVGQMVRSAVYDYTFNILNGSSWSWDKAFKLNENNDKARNL